MVGGSWGVAGRCRRLRKQTRTNRVHLFLPIFLHAPRHARTSLEDALRC
jgi:hypothetical protein